MREATREQQSVLDSRARVRVVRAVPGSGKTWLVAELIRQELDKWPSGINGIAALSFTNVGGHEIRNAIGHDLDYPHFVGTIDAFLFRYVVRPFLCSCFPGNFKKMCLIPADMEPTIWTRYAKNSKTDIRCDDGSINILDCTSIDEDENGAVFAAKLGRWGSLRRLNGFGADQVWKAKLEQWRKTGKLTHSDAALWASMILEHPDYGPQVRAEIVRRFPLIIIDELQDTGYFLGKSLRLILGEKTVRGVLVGDPDQAIFEFTGARPEMFDEFESIIDGVVSHALDRSLRCPPAVATAASHLKHTGNTICPSIENDGRAFLVCYKDMVVDTKRVVNAITRDDDKSVKVITRANKTVYELNGKKSKDVPKLHCRPLNHMSRAVKLFRQGHQINALWAARAAIDLAVFDHEGAEDDQLRDSGIDPHKWKLIAVRCLLRSNAVPSNGTIYDWQMEAGKILDEEIGDIELHPPIQFDTGRLKPQQRKDYDKLCEDCLPKAVCNESSKLEFFAQTVHSVKGETHDVTVFVCPPKRINNCYSDIWWSDSDKDREEKRIAYVAMTRTKGDLIILFSSECYKRLKEKRIEFTDCFELMSVDEFILNYPTELNIKFQ